MVQGNSLRLLLYLFCGPVVAACTSTAPPSQPTQSTQVATAAPAPETVAAAESQPADLSQVMVCKSVIPTGTRFQKRACKTTAEWARIQQGGRVAGEEIQRKGVQTGNPTEPPGGH